MRVCQDQLGLVHAAVDSARRICAVCAAAAAAAAAAASAWRRLVYAQAHALCRANYPLSGGPLSKLD